MKRRISRILALPFAAVLASLVMAPTSPAYAIPTGCSFDFWNTSANSYAICTGGTGEYQATLKCDIPWGIDTVARGRWMPVTNPPGSSIAQCPLDARGGYNPGIARR